MKELFAVPLPWEQRRERLLARWAGVARMHGMPQQLIDEALDYWRLELWTTAERLDGPRPMRTLS